MGTVAIIDLASTSTIEAVAEPSIAGSPTLDDNVAPRTPIDH